MPAREAVSMIARLVLGLLADLVFESAAARRRRLGGKLARHLGRRRRPAPAPVARKPA